MLDRLHNSCESLAGPGPEVANTASSLVVLAVGLWFALRPRQPSLARPMGVLAAMLGVGGLVAHSWPNILTEILSMIPLVLLFATVFFAYARDILRLSRGEAATAVVVILPFVAVSLSLFVVLEGPASTAGYAALPVFMLGIAVVLRQSHPATAARVLLATVLLLIGLALRAVDLPLCPLAPHGTHALWHLISAVVIWILICTYRRHLLAAPGAHG